MARLRGGTALTAVGAATNADGDEETYWGFDRLRHVLGYLGVEEEALARL